MEVKQKVTLPEDISDITLGQYQEYIKLLDLDADKQKKKKVSLFTGLSTITLKQISIKDFEEMSEQIDKALDQACDFTNRFKLKGIEFGFIPNFDKITTAEFVDLSKYNTEPETLHNLMAILFRPITKKALQTYDIESYNGTGMYAEMMKEVPLNYVNGALVFFCNLQRELLKATQIYTNQEQKKVEQLQTILNAGDGMQPS